jgi:hypothetical protein
MCVSATIGFFIYYSLSDTQQSPESTALAQTISPLLVGLTAIVLGLLTTSVKAGFDAAYSARGDDAAQLRSSTAACATTVPRRRPSASNCADMSPR